MTSKIIKIVLPLNIFICLAQTALIKNQVAEELNNNYEQNSLEEPRFPARTSTEKYSTNPSVRSDADNYVLDSFDHRYPDGSYEFRYELADGQARYERGYFIKVNNQKSLVVVGYYSYRLPDGKYVTVFYNADQNGYRQNQAINRDSLPNLPRTIAIPDASEEESNDIDTSTFKDSFHQVSSTTKRNRL